MSPRRHKQFGGSDAQALAAVVILGLVAYGIGWWAAAILIALFIFIMNAG